MPKAKINKSISSRRKKIAGITVEKGEEREQFR